MMETCKTRRPEKRLKNDKSAYCTAIKPAQYINIFNCDTLYLVPDLVFLRMQNLCGVTGDVDTNQCRQ